MPWHASLFFFNDLAFLVIPRKSLKSRQLLFSIPTAPTNLLSYQYVKRLLVFHSEHSLPASPRWHRSEAPSLTWRRPWLAVEPQIQGLA